MSKLYVIRHCESMSNRNLSHLIEVPDHKVELSDLGKVQATQTGKTLLDYLETNKTTKLYIFVSPFVRTLQTNEGILGELGNSFDISIHEEPMISEMNVGIFTGLTKEEQKEIYPIEFERYNHVFKHEGRYWAQFPYGESPFMVESRLLNLLDRSKKLINDKTAVVFITHSVVARVIKRRLSNISSEDYHTLKSPKNGEIYCFDLK